MEYKYIYRNACKSNDRQLRSEAKQPGGQTYSHFGKVPYTETEYSETEHPLRHTDTGDQLNRSKLKSILKEEGILDRPIGRVSTFLWCKLYGRIDTLLIYVYVPNA